MSYKPLIGEGRDDKGMGYRQANPTGHLAQEGHFSPTGAGELLINGMKVEDIVGFRDGDYLAQGFLYCPVNTFIGNVEILVLVVREYIQLV